MLLIVDHDPFKSVDPESLRSKIVLDTKGIWNSRGRAESPRT